MKDLKKYSIELLASKCFDLITFENGDTETWVDYDIEFLGSVAYVSGVIYGIINMREAIEFYKAELTDVELVHDDGEKLVFNTSEIKELESEIKRYL